MTEKVRIEKIMQHEHMSSGQFAIEIGVQNSTLSHILNNRNNPSLDVLKKILNRFPEISSDWLILGQGSMFRNEFNSQEPTLFDNEPLISLKSEPNIHNSPIVKNLNSEASGISSSVIREISLNDQKQSLDAIQKNTVNSDNSDVIPKENLATSSVSMNMLQGPEKKIEKIIIYFSDRTFQEFDSK